jgi:hypothetical protein
MNRWQAIAEIVTRYIEKGHPGYALAALTLLLLTGFGVAILVYITSAPAWELLR